MSDYKRLLVWRKAHAVSLNVHRTAATIRGSHYASLRSQMIRSAMSVAANIVEGRAQRSDRDFARFLQHAAASAAELEYHVTAARDIGVVGDADASPLLAQIDEISRMLRGLIAKLEGVALKRKVELPPDT